MRQAFGGGAGRKCRDRRRRDDDIGGGQDCDRQARRWGSSPALSRGVTPSARAMSGHIARQGGLDEASDANERQHGEQDNRQAF